MSDYDADDFADYAFLEELDAIEAAASQLPSTNPAKNARTPTGPLNKLAATANQNEKARFKPALCKEPSSDDFDETFDLDPEELHKLDQFIADSYAGKAQPVAGPSKVRQTTLDGQILSPPRPAPQAQAKRQFSRTVSSGPKEPKVKIWDRTAYAETGKKVTKKKGAKDKEKPKDKGKDAARAEDGSEDFDEEEYPEFAQFPSPQQEIGPPPPMRLKPDLLAAKDWIFPLNRPRRDYQFNIAKKCFFQNTLVALPTGLGKTFIAGVVMLNFYRWFPGGKIVFVAPTKPLVAQQVSACHDVCGIPGRDATRLTGEIPSSKRRAIIAQKRVLYMTPQTLVNDLQNGVIDALDIILIVIDEAHRGTGEYAYGRLVRHMMAKNPHHRILALTATPGNDSTAVQAIIDTLHITHIEIRNESSFDLQQYIHQKETALHVIKMDDTIRKLQGLLCTLMNPLFDKLRKENLVQARNAITLHHYSCIAGFEKAKKLPSGSFAWVWAYLRVLGSLSRAMGNLMESSASACYRSLKELKETLVNDDKRNDKYVHLLSNPAFVKLLEECEHLQASGFPPHPKMKALVEIIMDHFNNGPSNGASSPDTTIVGQTPDDRPSSGTRVMIFVSRREVIDEVVDVLDQYRPMLRAARFVGQGTDKKGKKGLAQAEQLEIIRRFKEGDYNILVSTSVGEEGLDIGEIDRIICYDCSKSSIQMLQRVGRTGRQRTGYVDVLLAEEREENNWDKSKNNYADVQQSIISGNQLELYTDAERLLPDNIQPSCLQIMMPIERYEPPTKQTPAPRKDPKEKKRKRNDDIHRNIPLGAFTGFVQASKLRPKTPEKKAKKSKNLRLSVLEDDTDDEEIAKGPSYDSLKAKASKSKSRAGPNSKNGQRSLLDLLKAPIPDHSDDDVGPPALRGKRKGREPSNSAESSVSPMRPRKQRRTIVTSDSGSSDSDVVSAHSMISPVAAASSSGATVASPQASTEPETRVEWLLHSDSEGEVRNRASRRLDGKKKGLPMEDMKGFQSARSLNTVSSSENDDLPNENHPAATSSSPSQGLASQPTVSPETMPSVSGPKRRKRLLCAPPSSPTGERGSPRRLTRRQSPSIMAPTSTAQSHGRKMKKTKLNVKENPALFDFEAVHSGDEVSEGDSSDVDMVESDTDRRFVVDVPETQVSPSYNQTLAYRTGLMTQVPNDGNGPFFQTKKRRMGLFAGGRTQIPKPDDWSSPTRSSHDEYEIGTFVVNDDEPILYDQSSEA